MSRLLICDPRGGMGNRMLAVLSSILIADRTNRSLMVMWDAIDLPKMPRSTGMNEFWKCSGIELCGRQQFRERKIKVDLRIPLGQAQRGPPFSLAGSEEVVYTLAHGIIQCKECPSHRGRHFMDAFNKHFKLTDKLQERADRMKELLSKTASYVIAAYVRVNEASHGITRKWKPVQKFLDAVCRSEPSSDTVFFLACDCQHAASKIRKAIPQSYKRRIIIPRVYEPDTVKAWKASAVNAYLCTIADEFYGSIYSKWTTWITALRGEITNRYMDDM